MAPGIGAQTPGNVLSSRPQRASGASRAPGRPAKGSRGYVWHPGGPGSNIHTQPAAGVPQAAPASTPNAAAATPGPLDAHDSTYFQNVTGEHFKTGNAINAINEQSAYARTDLQKALAQLAQKQPLDIEKARESYNNQGLLYSGHLGQSLGQIGQSYADRQSALNTNFAKAQAARDARVAALGEGERLYNEGQDSAATQRASKAAASDATLGVTPEQAPDRQPAATHAAYGGKGGLTFGPGGGYRYYGPNSVIGKSGNILHFRQAGLTVAQWHALLHQGGR